MDCSHFVISMQLRDLLAVVSPTFQIHYNVMALTNHKFATIKLPFTLATRLNTVQVVLDSVVYRKQRSLSPVS